MPTLWRYHRKAVLFASVPLLALLAVLGVLAVALHIQHRTSSDNAPGTNTPTAVASNPVSAGRSSSPSPSTDTATPSPVSPSDIASWDAIAPVTPGVSANYPAITGDSTTGRYDYAKAFITELFTQDYRKPRAALLAWAQYESVPIVTNGLPPADEAKGLVDSLTDLTWDNAPTAPVPPAGEWLSLQTQSGYQTVSDVTVTADSLWQQEIAAGHATKDKKMVVLDASLTVTLHAKTGGQATTLSSSVTCKVMLGTSTHGQGYGAMYVGTYNVTAAS